MKIDHRGITINGIQRVEPSQSYKNTVAILDSDNAWIHIPEVTLQKLLNEYQRMTAPKIVPPTSRVVPKVEDPFSSLPEFKVDTKDPFRI